MATDVITAQIRPRPRPRLKGLDPMYCIGSTADQLQTSERPVELAALFWKSFAPPPQPIPNPSPGAFPCPPRESPDTRSTFQSQNSTCQSFKDHILPSLHFSCVTLYVLYSTLLFVSCQISYHHLAVIRNPLVQIVPGCVDHAIIKWPP